MDMIVEYVVCAFSTGEVFPAGALESGIVYAGAIGVNIDIRHDNSDTAACFEDPVEITQDIQAVRRREMFPEHAQVKNQGDVLPFSKEEAIFLMSCT